MITPTFEVDHSVNLVYGSVHSLLCYHSSSHLLSLNQRKEHTMLKIARITVASIPIFSSFISCKAGKESTAISCIVDVYLCWWYGQESAQLIKRDVVVEFASRENVMLDHSSV